MKPSVEVHLLSFNEEAMIGYAVRHYATFADKVIVHDGRSTDRTREIAIEAGAEVVDWDTGNKLNDVMARDLKNACWKGTKTDWCICVDADELVFFPDGAEKTLSSYEALGLPIIRCEGWDMFSDRLPLGKGQIYDEIREGVREDFFYGKPILFRPGLVKEMNFDGGAHHANPVLKDGKMFDTWNMIPGNNPRALLLHFKWIGALEYLTNRLRRRRARLSEANIHLGWGNYEDPLVLARRTIADYRRRKVEVIPHKGEEAKANAYSVVILSNSIENVATCVASIRIHQGYQIDVIVVYDGISAEDRNQRRGLGVRWVEGERPFSYSANANIGINAAGRNDVIMLNDDVELLTDGGFDALAAGSLGYGVVGPVIEGRGGEPRQKIPHKGIMEETFFIVFICAYIPRRTLDIVGPMDELFFPGTFEDIDFCRRVQVAGMKLGIVGECTVDHEKKRTHFSVKADYQEILHANCARYERKWNAKNQSDGTFRYLDSLSKEPVMRTTPMVKKTAAIALGKPLRSVLPQEQEVMHYGGRVKFTVSIVAFNNLHLTKRCVESVLQSSADFELILTDNASTDGTMEYFDSFASGFIRVIHNSENLGFEEPNKKALEIAKGDYFVLLNNDTEVEPLWLEKMEAAFNLDPMLAIAGREGGCSELDDSFQGRMGPKLEYIDGACLMVKTDLVRKHGLFAPYLKFAYGEDSDLSLRMLRLGYTIRTVRVDVKHVGGATSSNLANLEAIWHANHSVLRKVWAPYIKTRRVNFPIVIRRDGDYRDVLLSTALMRRLHDDWPLCPIYYQTKTPEAFECHPFATSMPRTTERATWLIDLNMAYEARPGLHIIDAYAQAAGLVGAVEHRTELACSGGNMEWAAAVMHENKDNPWCALHVSQSRSERKNWSLAQFSNVAMGLQEIGWNVALVGKGTAHCIPCDLDLLGKTTFGSLAAVIKRCALFVGTDSAPIAIAQAVGTPVIGIFPATDPQLCLTEGSEATALTGDVMPNAVLEAALKMVPLKIVA